MTIYEGKNHVSSAYGWRTHPITGKRTFHYGKDVVGQTSKKQRLVVPQGVVQQVNLGYQGGRGNNVVIRSVNDPVRPDATVLLRYQHQSGTTLKVGQTVHIGDVVGTEGSTGDSTGSHCHFEVTVNGKTADPSPWDGLPNAVGTYSGNNSMGGAGLTTLTVGPVSAGDENTLTALAQALELAVSRMATLAVGPMTGGDKATLLAKAKELGLAVATTEKKEGDITFYTLAIGPMSAGDEKTIREMADALLLPTQALATLAIGPMSSGDVKTIRAKAEELQLKVTEE